MIDALELDALKAKDLPGVLADFTTLRRASGREMCGPCPRCGGVDRFHVGRERDGSRWWWFCRKCHPRRGDVVEFARWLLGYDFAQAVAWAHGGVAVVMPSTTPRVPAAPVATTRVWDATQVERKIDAACVALVHDGALGQAGRAYLAKRGITMATADKFFVGAHMAWDRQLHHERPALALPWANGDVVEAVKYRFVEVPAGGMRFTSEGGSTFSGIFGRNAYSGCYNLLVVVEGEVNAMSVHQAARQAGYAIDCVSIGSESSALGSTTVALVADVATDFNRVLMWLDKPEYAAALRDAVPGSHAIRSHRDGDGVKWDANELLQNGMLVEFLIRIMARLWPTNQRTVTT